MRRIFALLLVVLFALAARADFPSFRMEEIAKDLGVGYAVLLVDVDGDGKLDIVVVDQTRVVWYQNPTWKRRVIIENQTKPDNVCIAAYDIDGDGKIDFALGADWKPFNTKDGGTIQWLKRGKTLDEKWTVYPIGEEPTVHRMRFADIDGSGKPHLVVVPLMGRNSTQKANWMDGSPVRILAYKIPKDPVKDRWVPEVLSERFHVVHGFFPLPPFRDSGNLLTASYDGVGLVTRFKGKWESAIMDAADQQDPKGSRGASEIKRGRLKNDEHFIATIQPWHGNRVVVYPMPSVLDKRIKSQLLDDKLKWGHALWWADLDGDGGDQLIVGVRDDIDPKDPKPGERRGVRLYKAVDENGTKWERHILDDGGVAVEDLAAADLDGDGKIDIVAVGRQTHNIRIYWNLGKK
jgi:hypothetical protein